MDSTSLKPPYWSASRLQMLLRCPRQFRYCYLDGIPAIATAPLAFGRTVHDVLRSAGEEHMATDELPVVPEMVRRFAVAWKRVLDENTLDFAPNQPTRDDFLLLGGEMLERFYDRFAHRPPPLAVELAFEMPWGDSTLVGFIDRVDEGDAGLIVTDYKTGRRKPSSREAASDLHFTVYALAARHALGQNVERLEFLCLRDGATVATTRSEPESERLLGATRICAERTLQEGEFSPRPGFWCRFCDYRELCAAEGGLNASHR